MEIEVTVNLENLPAEIEKYAREALKRTGDSVIDDIENAHVVPKMTTTMEQTLRPLDVSELESNNTVSIHSDTPYARRLYEHPEYNFHREPWTDSKGNTWPGNENAKAEWFRDWEEGDRKQWVVDIFGKHLKAVMK